MQLSKKQKTFSEFFTAFWKSRSNFEHFDRKDYPHKCCNFEITHSENVVRQMSKKTRFREPFDKQHGKRAWALLKFASQHVYHIHWLRPSQLTWKKSLLLTCPILGLFPNTLLANEKYALLKKDNLAIAIQMKLSQKVKTFSTFFAAFLKSRLNREYFEKKDDPHRFCISEITDSEKVVR